MGHFFKSKPSTCTCFLPSPPLSALPRLCQWCTTPPSTSRLTRSWSECPASSPKAPWDQSDRVTLLPTKRPPLTRRMALHRWAASRSKCTGAPARAPAMTLSPPGDTTTPSPSTWARTTRPHSDDPDLARNHDQSVAQPKTFFTPSSLGRPSQDPDVPWSFQGGLRLRTLGILQHPAC